MHGDKPTGSADLRRVWRKIPSGSSLGSRASARSSGSRLCSLEAVSKGGDNRLEHNLCLFRRSFEPSDSLGLRRLAVTLCAGYCCPEVELAHLWLSLLVAVYRREVRLVRL